MSSLLTVAIEAAHAAGKLQREGFGSELVVNELLRHDIKLDLDVRCQELISQNSGMICFAVQDYLDRTGLPISTIRSALDEAERKGLITQSLGHVTPTERGFDFLSDLQELFLAPE